MKTKSSNLKGFKTYFGKEAIELLLIQNEIYKIMSMSGYKYLYFPLIYKLENFKFEHSNLSNQMFVFSDKKGQKISLVPEFTKPTIVHYNSKYKEYKKNEKFFYFQPCFRYEKPQFCRQRQFFQLGIELVKYSFSERLIIENIILILNIINDFIPKDYITINLSMFPKEKKDMLENLRNKINIKTLCNFCQKRWIKKNIWNILECKNCNQNLKIPNFSKFLPFLKSLKKKIISLRPEYKNKILLHDSIIRGINYYNGLMLEINFNIKKERTICLAGGGEYINSEHPEDKNFGIAIGIDRLLSIKQKFFPDNLEKKIFLNIKIAKYNWWYKNIQNIDFFTWKKILKFFIIEFNGTKKYYDVKLEVKENITIFSKQQKKTKFFEINQLNAALIWIIKEIRWK